MPWFRCETCRGALSAPLIAEGIASFAAKSNLSEARSRSCCISKTAALWASCSTVGFVWFENCLLTIPNCFRIAGPCHRVTKCINIAISWLKRFLFWFFCPFPELFHGSLSGKAAVLHSVTAEVASKRHTEPRPFPSTKYVWCTSHWKRKNSFCKRRFEIEIEILTEVWTSYNSLSFENLIVVFFVFSSNSKTQRLLFVLGASPGTLLTLCREKCKRISFSSVMLALFLQNTTTVFT